MEKQELLVANDVFMAIMEGRNTLTIRKGRRDIQLGKLTFKTPDGVDEMDVEVIEVRYIRASGVSDEICQQCGFKDWVDFITGMKRFYPDFSPETEVSIIIFE